MTPNTIVVYVQDIKASSDFYRDLFELTPDELSPTYHEFTFPHGLQLGLKLQPDYHASNGELSFTVEGREQVDALYNKWLSYPLEIAERPTEMPFGYNFIAIAPGGQRLRFLALG